MTSKDFTNWLRGYIAGNDEMSTKVKNDITKALDNVDDVVVRPAAFAYKTAMSGTDFVNTTSNIKA
jgi:hypothetical protein